MVSIRSGMLLVLFYISPRLLPENCSKLEYLGTKMYFLGIRTGSCISPEIPTCCCDSPILCCHDVLVFSNMFQCVPRTSYYFVRCSRICEDFEWFSTISQNDPRISGAVHRISWHTLTCPKTVSYTHLTLPTILRV